MDILALVLSIVGCLNWGLVGIFKFDLVAWLFGPGAVLSRIIYTVSVFPVFGVFLSSCGAPAWAMRMNKGKAARMIRAA